MVCGKTATPIPALVAATCPFTSRVLQVMRHRRPAASRAVSAAARVMLGAW